MDAAREYVDLLADGDPEATASAAGWPGAPRHDPVATWPSDRLGELIEQRPDLLGELIRRRGSEVVQL